MRHDIKHDDYTLQAQVPPSVTALQVWYLTCSSAMSVVSLFYISNDLWLM